MDEIKVQFHEDFKKSCTVSFVSWSRLMDKGIKEAIGLKPTEKITGLKVDERGVNVYLKYIS